MSKAPAAEEDRNPEERLVVAERSLEPYTVRWVEVHEHQNYLSDAIAKAERRLVIVSPWIKRAVVDQPFVGALEAALKRGVGIWIGYGMKDDQSNDERALGDLRALSREWDRCHLYRFANSHAKVLICDSAYAIVGSFNWLSFRGSQDRTFRDERSVYVGIPAKVEELFGKLQGQFVVAQAEV